ncbi:hypothetical protein SAMN05444166_5529 [Singulisphaera sp. GP187]|uniref:hypothetical protein n=1 Tax=Singulisphaera sp. GP187 TaxID=1882752 RepID=UPI000928A38A|nr:hypothetical protein [Singulisphaera sp. GP187]SIO57942.1 hypothetical protein SAMN05444166_5529 [Singulisphaera sp. GP187]
MTAKTERQIFRWLHLILSIPILGLIYGPVAEIPSAALATRYVFVPIVILSGFWMWKGHVVRRYLSGPKRQARTKQSGDRYMKSSG